MSALARLLRCDCGCAQATGKTRTTHLLGADPAHLGVRNEVVPGGAHVLEELLNLLALNAGGDQPNRVADLTRRSQPTGAEISSSCTSRAKRDGGAQSRFLGRW
jgi:hypothetical protein